MRLHLVGADFEENLGVGMIASAASRAGHDVTVVPFNDPERVAELAPRIAAANPDVVGLSIQFQHRAHEFLSLARALRAAGYRGHITSGGQFPTLAWQEVLHGKHGVDSVVLHEGERTIVELLEAVGMRRPLHDVRGLALLGDDEAAYRTGARALERDLDTLPSPARYRAHSRHLGIPFVPILGSRGCWGSCSYCSITSFYRDARSYGGGATVRMRSPENVADEMAAIWHRVGGPCIYCFHDDNFLLPRPKDTLDRVRSIRRHLDARGVGKVGIIGKCRPDCVTADLAAELRALGVIRLYVGVENASELGAAHLRRSAQQPAVERALEACRRAGIFVCYNLLLFEPDTTLAHVRENIAFVLAHPSHPVNFCRAEPYYGTPLHLDLASRGTLGGSYLGFDYRMADIRSELLFRICAAAFRQRNFAPNGVANRTMGLGYSAKILEHFYDDPDLRRRRLLDRATELTSAVSEDTARHLADALALAEHTDLSDRETLEREAALLGLRISAADGGWHARLDELQSDMQAFAVEALRARPSSVLARSLRRVAQGAAIGASLALFGCDDDTVVDPVPSDAGRDAIVVDPPPRDAGMDVMVSDPLPPDMGMEPDVMV
ncbi:MAG: B12-binding domain-containing radical SAM protein, partial [Deltaproteobacteria bacterium]|nr:B12-binding domain-containing radical SAM protein [Deltaproteobacteria bacterium]